MLSKLMQTPIYRNAGMSVETAMPPHWWINKRHDFDLNLLALSGGQHPTRWNKHHSLLGWFPLLTPCSSASPLDTALKTMIDIYWVICLIAGENCALFWYFSEMLLSPPPPPSFSSAYWHQWCNVPIHSSEKNERRGKKRARETENLFLHEHLTYHHPVKKMRSCCWVQFSICMSGCCWKWLLVCHKEALARGKKIGCARAHVREFLRGHKQHYKQATSNHYISLHFNQNIIKKTKKKQWKKKTQQTKPNPADLALAAGVSSNRC